jgi:hypothetical protein
MPPKPSVLQRSNATFERLIPDAGVYNCYRGDTDGVRESLMRTFIVACIAAAVIAVCAVLVLNRIQEPVSVAFTTSAVRI